jgi:hypothetical protein
VGGGVLKHEMDMHHGNGWEYELQKIRACIGDGLLDGLTMIPRTARGRHHGAGICTKNGRRTQMKTGSYDWKVLLRPAFSFCARGRPFGASVMPEKGVKLALFFFLSFLSFLPFLPSVSFAWRTEGALA